MLGKYRKFIMDFLYSVVAYALPTVALQLVIQPVIAAKLPEAQNGLFLTILSGVRLGVNVFISALANLRLLEKGNCQHNPEQEKKMNFLFSVAALLCTMVSFIFTVYYCGGFDAISVVLVMLVALLIAFHDYYSIQFRVNIDYKKTVIDNMMIVVGYAVGTCVFLATLRWEYVFIGGYLSGSCYVLITGNLWRKGVKAHREKKLCVRYAELSTSYALNNSITYCDKLLMFPVLGGASVSTYNAASVVSKVLSLVSVPLRNVLLSYIVNKNEIRILKRKFKYITIGLLAGIAVLYVGGCGVSYFLCAILYPAYYSVASRFIPVIIGTIVIETTTSMGNVILLQFAETKLQTVVSSTKLGLYVALIVLFEFVLHLDLLGFCLAGFAANAVKMCIVGMQVKKHIHIVDANEGSETGI